MYQQGPHRRDYLVFYEYFHGDNGGGPGVSRQTGWTGNVSRIPEVGRAVRFGRDGPRK